MITLCVGILHMILLMFSLFVFFFKQKTAYEMRISDWSSNVCSSDLLAHELVHAAVGIPAGHGKAFKRVALGLGLVGPMRATTPGEAFLAAIAPILESVGPLPHARLDTDGESTAPKKQKARMLKCECATCGYTVRTARKWLE